MAPSTEFNAVSPGNALFHLSAALFAFLLAASLVPTPVSARPFIGAGRRVTHEINWNISNPMFDRSNTDHVVDVEVGDKINLNCPVYNVSDPAAYPEYHALYLVTRDQYTSCRLNVDRPASFRWIFSCASPRVSNVFSLLVTPFSPHPFGFEFQPGRDYYVMTPSSGFESGLNDAVGGLCRSMNMKMVLRVACKGCRPEETLEEGPSRPRQVQQQLERHQQEQEQRHRDSNDIEDEFFRKNVLPRRGDGVDEMIEEELLKPFRAHAREDDDEDVGLSNRIPSFSSREEDAYLIDYLTPLRRTDGVDSSSSAATARATTATTLIVIAALTMALARW